jgi:asparagine synthase (glutamine-hydrolysing)
MCGIAGVISADRDQVHASVSAAVSALEHRGPDNTGSEIRPLGQGWIGLGHRRLSVLDLSALGHQPMTHAPTGATIVFNGEIYNFRRLRVELEGEGETFRTESDTEVLLAGLVRHGEAYLGRLEGMYAFAFYDPRSESVLLARDPAGIKPLYIATGQAMFAFASEVRAIRATGIVRGELDRRAIAGFLAYGALQHPLTLFEGIRSLNPGSCLTVGVAPHGG